jgi:hypothetical protein
LSRAVRMRRNRKAKKRGSRSRIVDDLMANAVREVAEAWSRAESDGALTDAATKTLSVGPRTGETAAGERGKGRDQSRPSPSRSTPQRGKAKPIGPRKTTAATSSGQKQPRTTKEEQATREATNQLSVRCLRPRSRGSALSAPRASASVVSSTPSNIAHACSRASGCRGPA